MLKLWILPTERICVFRMILIIKASVSLNIINRLVFVAEMFRGSCEARNEFVFTS
jgi:hypothetical protein